MPIIKSLHLLDFTNVSGGYWFRGRWQSDRRGHRFCVRPRLNAATSTWTCVAMSATWTHTSRPVLDVAMQTDCRDPPALDHPGWGLARAPASLHGKQNATCAVGRLAARGRRRHECFPIRHAARGAAAHLAHLQLRRHRRIWDRWMQPAWPALDCLAPRLLPSSEIVGTDEFGMVSFRQPGQPACRLPIEQSPLFTADVTLDRREAHTPSAAPMRP